MAEEILSENLEVVQEDPKPKIYKFLKDNGLTTKDETTFNSEYSNPEKQKELYKFMKENQLTNKDFNAFSSDNFGDFLKYTQPKRGFWTRLGEWFTNIYYAITIFPSA